ncbi:MAG: helix-turn-helix domain-containing protein, partial [Desulfurococcales archaeon]|nr:helix-turn-helix domain-containing protein [Desulfurococcales archaeon]
MQVFNHVISKRSRRRIVEILAATRSMRGLAEEIGVSPAAIHKYITGKTHPSDEVVKRMIELADYEETRKIAEAILDDLS